MTSGIEPIEPKGSTSNEGIVSGVTSLLEVLVFFSLGFNFGGKRQKIDDDAERSKALIDDLLRDFIAVKPEVCYQTGWKICSNMSRIWN
jgi:hypothetical protein